KLPVGPRWFGRGSWLRHVHQIYPNEADHIIMWFAHRVQRRGEKINHALVLGGEQGIGKDTIVEPLIRARSVLGTLGRSRRSSSWGDSTSSSSRPCCASARCTTLETSRATNSTSIARRSWRRHLFAGPATERTCASTRYSTSAE